MKIATWNVERLKHRKQLGELTRLCEGSGADILVLTEADEQIMPDFPHKIASPHLDNLLGVPYNPTERAVMVFSKYEIKTVYPPFNAISAVAVEQETEIGRFILYGVIIGRFGNRHPEFMNDLNQLCKDIDLITQKGYKLCICGDFNLSFSDNYYYTKEGRAIIDECFRRNEISLVTAGQPECIDHIAVSTTLLRGSAPLIMEWNENKKLSDHKGIMISF